MSKKKIGFVQYALLAFGFFMVLFYLAVAVLLVKGVFPLPKYLSWFFAVAFGAYGIYRFYREIKGEHTYGMRINDNDDEEEERYGTYKDFMKQNDHNDEKK